MPKLHGVDITKLLEKLNAIFNSIGDAGDSPSNTTGYTALRRLGTIEGILWDLRNSLLPRYAYDTSTGATLSITLTINDPQRGRSHVIVCVKSSGTGKFYVYGSHDNSRWWLIDTIDYTTANEDVVWPPVSYGGAYRNAFPYIKVETDIVADNEILIVASR